MDPQGAGIDTRLRSRREATVQDRVLIGAPLTPVARRSLRVHQPVRAAQPEVVDGHDERRGPVAGGHVHRWPEVGVGVVQVHDIGPETVQRTPDAAPLGGRVRHAGSSGDTLLQLRVAVLEQLDRMAGAQELDLLSHIPVLPTGHAIEAVDDQHTRRRQTVVGHDPHGSGRHPGAAAEPPCGRCGKAPTGDPQP